MEENIKVRVLISADAEGITGIFKKPRATPDRLSCGQFHSLMAHDVNAAIHDVLTRGATEVVVNDSYNYNDNVLPVDLDPRASLTSGTDKSLITAEGLTEQVGVLMLVGYHSRKGAKGVISHIYYYLIVVDAAVNGAPFGEVESVSHVAGYYGVPTALLTGDDCVTASAEKQTPGVHTAVVKKVVGNGSTRLYHPERTGKLIEEAAKAAVSEYRTIAPVELGGPMTLTITFATATQAAHACKVPGFILSKEQGNVISYTCDDYLELYKALLNAL